MAEHHQHPWTVGPWFVRERPADDGLAVIEDGRDNGLSPIRCEWTEAPLVAASPDLYVVLDAVQWAAADRFRCVECGGQPSTGHTKNCRVGTALAKARGETTEQGGQG